MASLRHHVWHVGILIRGECTPGGNALLRVDATANNGVIHWSGFGENTNTGFTHSDPDYDTSDGLLALSTVDLGDTRRFGTTLNYRGASGTTLTGNLQLARATGVAQCVISGMLLVG